MFKAQQKGNLNIGTKSKGGIRKGCFQWRGHASSWFHGEPWRTMENLRTTQACAISQGVLKICKDVAVLCNYSAIFFQALFVFFFSPKYSAYLQFDGGDAGSGSTAPDETCMEQSRVLPREQVHDVHIWSRAEFYRESRYMMYMYGGRPSPPALKAQNANTSLIRHTLPAFVLEGEEHPKGGESSRVAGSRRIVKSGT